MLSPKQVGKRSAGIGMGAVGRNSKQKAAWPPDIDGSKATFAAGCFWGPQVAFERVPGVLDTCVGYWYESLLPAI